MTLDIIIFAVIAIYIIIKLYNIIGAEDADSENNINVKSQSVINLDKEKDYVVVEDNVVNEKEIAALAGLQKALITKIDKVKTLDDSFLLNQFLDNSEKAFEMIISAFAKNDEKTLNLLTDEEAKDKFLSSLEQQNEQGNAVNIDIVSFLEKSISDISFKGNVCRITVLFVTEQIFYISDKDNKVIKGDMSKIEKIEDCWTFKKSLKSSNPIWHVVKTQS